MIIRSQNKEMVTNFNQVTNILLSEGEENKIEIVAMFAHDIREARLGTYSTEEKAIKVLDMIEKEYGKHFYGQGGELATANFYVPPFAFIPPKVFQMPADNEVEV